MAALVGFILGGLVASQTDRSYRSEAQVQITEPALLSPIDGATASLEVEARLAGSIVIRDQVRRTLPRADSVEVALADSDSIITIAAKAGAAEEARQLAQVWAETFIDVRQDALIERYAEWNTQLGAELDASTEALGTARLADDAAAILLAEQQRDALLEQRQNVEQSAQALQVDNGALVVRQAQRPTGQSGIGIVPLFFGGAVLGAMAAAVIIAFRERSSDVSSEDQLWTEASAQPVDDDVVAANAWPADDVWAEAGFTVPTSLAAEGSLRVVAPQPLNGRHRGDEQVDRSLPADWADDISLISD